jgi:RNA polymerase sigma factor (sigma-70 family)
VHESASVASALRFITRGRRPALADEQALVARAGRGDREAIDRLISSNLAFVVGMAKEHRGRGVPFEDLIAEGCVGLLKAIRRYRPESGTRFMTYASFWVRKEILAAVVEQPHPVHVPRYARDHGTFASRPVRLDAGPGGTAESPLSGLLRDELPGPAETAIAREHRARVRRHLLTLPPREQAVLAWRFGLGGQPSQTLNEIGRRLGLSRERVRQIEVAALEELRGAVGTRANGAR